MFLPNNIGIPVGFNLQKLWDWNETTRWRWSQSNHVQQVKFRRFYAKATQGGRIVMKYMVKNTKSEVRILSFATSGILKFTKFQISVLFAKSLFQKWENYFSREIWSIILNIVKMKIILKRISIWEQESTKNIWSFWKGNTNMSWEKEMLKCIHSLHYTSMTHLFWMPLRLMSSLKTILETFQHLKNLVMLSTSVMHCRLISLDQIFVPTRRVLRVWEESESFRLSGMFWTRVNILFSWSS